MANTHIKPKMVLADLIAQLEQTNLLLFTLKQGTKSLISLVESGNMDGSKKAIEIFELKEVIAKLDSDE